jgi:peptide/nickel transport system permease protein
MNKSVAVLPKHTGPTHEPVNDVGQISQTRLVLMRFSRNKLAMTGVIALVIMYLMIAFAGFIAPNDYEKHNDEYLFGPPSLITFIGPNGNIGLQAYTYPMETSLDVEKMQYVFKTDYTKFVPIRFFIHGDPYELFGFIKSDIHLFGVEAPYSFYLMGADTFGRDMFARVLYGGQISMTVGWIGVILTVIFGSILGTASGYMGGIVDDVMQRIIEIIMSFPTIPLWAALAAALPPISSTFTGVQRYFLITVILSLVSWTGLARQLRAKVMAYRQSDFTLAALAAGASDRHIIFTHMIPNAMSHIIVVGALAIPNMILGETALSFLGLGILPPQVSWGALLRDAQQISVVQDHPWIMVPGVGVILTVLFFSFLGDGLRDAVDPYSI